jgi:hypothetical protein
VRAGDEVGEDGPVVEGGAVEAGEVGDVDRIPEPELEEVDDVQAAASTTRIATHGAPARRTRSTLAASIDEDEGGCLGVRPRAYGADPSTMIVPVVP